MRLFFRYLRSKAGLLGLLLLCAATIAFSLYLFGVSTAAVWYPLALCTLFCVIFLICDFSIVQEKHKALEPLKKLTADLLDELPGATAVPEADYREIIESLCAQQRAFSEQAAKDYRGMVDYYTVWAHQIKTPIASMRLALQNEDSPHSRRLQTELSRIEQYVSMVLTFLRLDSDSTDYVIREYALDAIVRGAVRKLAGSFIDKKLKLEYESLNTTVLTDEKWLSFVVEQVLSNAVKYTQTGSIRIFTEAGNTLCISDTGIGIAPEDLPRIFENGYTGFNGREDKRASGIGLYLCKRICDNLGHSIRAESELGKGTTVRICFPKPQM
ncbi:MAG: sensor histidine kinase [Clostridia bacterium]|nr:sensor histidine kinase [Clostridia bacterium]